jgi:hypothetical protein
MVELASVPAVAVIGAISTLYDGSAPVGGTDAVSGGTTTEGGGGGSDLEPGTAIRSVGATAPCRSEVGAGDLVQLATVTAQIVHRTCFKTRVPNGRFMVPSSIARLALECTSLGVWKGTLPVYDTVTIA